MLRIAKSIPMVLTFDDKKTSSVKRFRMADLPTPLSPTNTVLTIKSLAQYNNDRLLCQVSQWKCISY